MNTTTIAAMGKALPFIAVIAGLGVVAGGWWIVQRGGSVPDPPRHTGAAELNPMAVELVDECLAAVAADPRRAGARARLAMAYDANGLTEIAIEAYRQALAIDPGEPRWWYHLARAEAASGRSEAALEAMASAARLAPDHAPTHWRRGVWLLELGRVDDAKAAFERAGDEVAARVGLARACLARGESAEAVTRLEALAREFPDAGYINQLLGTAYQQSGRLRDAARALARADGRPPRYADPWANEVAALRRSYIATLQRADDLARGGQAGAALAMLEPLRAARPEDATLAAKIGEIRLTNGDHAGARRALERALRLDETYHPAHLHLSRSYLAQGELSPAARHVDLALELHPSLGPAHRQRAAIHLAAERWSEAEAALQDAIRYGADGVDCRVDLALARYQLGRFDDAAVTLDEALRRDPEHVRGLVLAALCQDERGDREGAAQRLRRASQLAPQDPMVREAAARLRERQPR